MFARAHSLLLAAAVALLAATPAVALTPQVKDEAKFFSAEAVQKADRLIREIKDRHGKDLLIETFPTVPDDRAEKVKHMDRSERGRFFEEWARERARQEGVNGVYVLICKEPGHVQVEVGNETRQRAFTVEDRDRLRDILVKAFKAKEYDQGLLDGVEYVRDTVQKNLGERGRARAGVPAPGGEGPAFPGGPRPGFALGPWVLGLLCLGVVGLLVLLAVVGWLSRPRGGYGPGGYAPGGSAPGGGYGPPAPGYGYGGGGGGFFSSLVGGMFGAAAGNWVYDRFFRGGSPNDSGGAYTSAPASPSPDTSDRPDTDYSGAGGDFDSGDSSDRDGGGDFGGSALGSGDFYGGGDDAGGGDTGGGDTGGGDDFGGTGDSGGGDF